MKSLRPTHPYIKVNGRWCYLYRAIDRSGALVDVRLSEKRDTAAAKAFFRSAKVVTDVTPARVTTGGHDSYPRAIRTELDVGVKHRTNPYLNNRIEQDHRGIKGRYGPMRASPFTPQPKPSNQRPPPSLSDPWDRRAPHSGSGLITGSAAASLDPPQWRDR